MDNQTISYTDLTPRAQGRAVYFRDEYPRLTVHARRTGRGFEIDAFTSESLARLIADGHTVRGWQVVDFQA